MTAEQPLARYHKRRDFSRTAEPKGRLAESSADQLSYVVQIHDARTLHFDFRLEADGILKSFAVPKGPSDDPHDKRFATPTEDHPLEYRDFEGTIPEGEYGGGTVIVWDQGTYHNGRVAAPLAWSDLHDPDLTARRWALATIDACWRTTPGRTLPGPAPSEGPAACSPHWPLTKGA
ncbi:DNA polymerase ligase N-terminal domain-containing protein [Streptomyces sp. WM6373]|uniref:DNA polymerase ligase N-terminal domain-containing protein n=1 Tax=Streptomyces sp. WM6373 TaxID=1415556 RepID=UPI00099D9911|nr:DNA polymerase ligase N-terminal domain-containing protein [Streptomyces sp. WM6373]